MLPEGKGGRQKYAFMHNYSPKSNHALFVDCTTHFSFAQSPGNTRNTYTAKMSIWLNIVYAKPTRRTISKCTPVVPAGESAIVNAITHSVRSTYVGTSLLLNIAKTCGGTRFRTSLHHFMQATTPYQTCARFAIVLARLQLTRQYPPSRRRGQRLSRMTNLRPCSRRMEPCATVESRLYG